MIVIVNGFMATAPAAGVSGSSLLLARVVGADHFTVLGQVFGTQIHHAGALPRSVLPVAIAMIEPPADTRLVRCPGSPNDLDPSRIPARLATASLPVVAFAADVEDRPASYATNFSLAVCRHVPENERAKLGHPSTGLAACRSSASVVDLKAQG
jgi:hypothetical protein